MQSKTNSIILFELFVLFSSFVFITGANLFIPSPLSELFESQPKLQRIFVSLLSLSAVISALAMHLRGRLKDSFLLAIVKKANLSSLAWTAIIFSVTASVFFYGSYIRYQVFQSGFDFAIFAQAIWNTWHGNFLYSSIKGGICLLGDHVSPFLALLAPLYGIWNDPVVLLLAQAVVATSAVFPLFLIGREVLKSEKLALIFVIAFALYLPLRNAVRFDFHPEVMGDALMLWAFYFMLKDRLTISSVFLVATLATKEIACAPVAMFGLYCWWFRKKAAFGIVWFLIAVAYFALCIFVVAPYFFGQKYFYLANYTSWQTYGFSAFSRYIFQISTLTYLKKIFLPLGLFSFLSLPAFLLTLPILVQNLTTPNVLVRSIYFQYTSLLTSAVFISAMYGFSDFTNWLNNKKSRFRQYPKLFSVYWIIGWSILLSGKADYQVIRQYQLKNSPHFNYVRKYLKMFQSSASVRTHEFFAPHLAARKELYIYENANPREGGSAKARNAEYVILDQIFLNQSKTKDIDSLREKGYMIQHAYDGFYVLKKRI